MHPTAIANCQQFFDCYGKFIPAASPAPKIVEIGSQDVNGSLRGCCPPSYEYLGVDFVAGKGVDLILTDPYQLPLPDDSADIVLSSSCFEHSEMFWLLFLEIMRIVKPGGLFYLNVPANGEFHRWPVDCWRFYPDSGRALVTWAKRNGMNPVLLESYISTQVGDQWNDFVAIFLKDESLINQFPDRIVNSKSDFYNGTSSSVSGFLKHSVMPEDKKKMLAIKQIIDNEIKII